MLIKKVYDKLVLNC